MGGRGGVASCARDLPFFPKPFLFARCVRAPSPRLRRPTMKAATSASKWGVFSLLLVLSVSLAATAQGPPRPPRPEPSPRLLDGVKPRAVESLAASTAGTIYVETFGTDSSRCGTQ